MRLDESQAKKTAAESTMRECVTTKLAQQEELAKLYMQRVHCNPADSKSSLSAPSVAQSLRIRVLVQIQCVISGCVTEKDVPSTLAACEKDLSNSTTTILIAETLLDLARSRNPLLFFSHFLNKSVGFCCFRASFQIIGENSKSCSELGFRCLELVERSNVTSPVVTVKLELCRAVKLVNTVDETAANKVVGRRLRSKEVEGFSIQTRLNAIKILERIVIMGSRIENNSLLEEICIAIWNASVPLLQSHLRLQVHNALRLAAAALEAMSSPLSRLRAQLHFELAKCEELSDFVAAAKEEAAKALRCDYGTIDDSLVNKKFGFVVGENIELDRDRSLDHVVQPLYNAYSVRSSVYDSPSDIEGKVVLILQQIKESSSLKFQNEMLMKAVAAMLRSISLIEPVVTRLDNTSELTVDDDRNTAVLALDAEVKALSQLSVGELPPVLEDVSLEDLEAAILLVRAPIPVVDAGKGVPKAAAKGAPAAAAPVEASSVKFTKFSRLTQQRIQNMSTIAKLSHARGNILPLQQSALYVLGMVFDPEDAFCRELIESQIEMFYLLAECLVFKIGKPQEKRKGNNQPTTMTLSTTGFGGLSPEGEVEVDSRALGLDTDDIVLLKTKKLVVSCLLHGLKLSLIMKDQYGIQNAIIYFWNLHIHITRKNLYDQAIPELLNFIQAAIDAVEVVTAPKVPVAVAAKDSKEPGSSSGTMAIPGYKPISQLDERLRISIFSMYCALLAAKSDYAAASEAAVKACAGKNLSVGEIYARKKLFEQAGLYQTASVNAASAASGTKGAKGGGGKAADGLKADAPMLSVFGLLCQGEISSDGSTASVPLEQYKVTCEKVQTIMDNDVGSFISSLDISTLTQETYDQLIEMQAEIWTRVTRMKILQGFHIFTFCRQFLLNCVLTRR
jgi:hypothetical protein